ncbi:hypothetical protein B591_00060 [Streptomyces sp. GBA 94-10 4N24]|nr:hypothetical protein B591_30234 [Streptomyces sp. GBA 94-10 4N24]ESQ01650.1 hypothetical protein B591_00060 [Streptomyces sp. GBA 94-10 4N24]UZN57054.1 hypothetical protein B591N_00060 [Streptomyces sp. GBA 94-10 4N24]UZN63034.1 hypothetical protein B591N_30234 [Streptomyces sp. GBA 94-10 4N24]
MGDRRPDTSVLNQDDPPAESSGAAHDAGPDAVGKHSGQGTEERAGAGAPKKPDAAETPEKPEEPEEPAAPEAVGAAPEAEGDEAAPDKGVEAVAEADGSEPGEETIPACAESGAAATECAGTAKDQAPERRPGASPGHRRDRPRRTG